MALQAKEDTIAVFKQVKEGYRRDKIGRLAAALAYFAALSLAPLIILAVLAAGLIFGQAAAEGEIVRRTQDTIGRQGAEMIQSILQNANRPSGGLLAMTIGVGALLLGASKLFGEMQQALNKIWDVRQSPSGWKGLILKRVVSCAMVVAAALLLPVLTVATVVLDAAAGTIAPDLPAVQFLIRAAGLLVPVLLIGALLALIYRYVPDATTSWREIWIAAGITSVLFLVMRVLVGLYLSRSTTASAYGAAGSFVVVLLWLYFSALVFYLGAEITVALGRRKGEIELEAERPSRVGHPVAR